VFRISLTTLALLGALNSAAATTEQQPIDVLREHVAAGIAVLSSDATKTAENYIAQQQQLCAIARERFDLYAFSRLVLAGNWREFSGPQQNEFVDVFGEFLCRYYLGRLQAHYSNEHVSFDGQTIKTANRASVAVMVEWRDLNIPIEVRMTRRGGQWKAYDIVMAGISGVMIYRAQFEALLVESSPADVIKELQRRIDKQPDGPLE
jgi:phospholipid transport system substrate-binding protein